MSAASCAAALHSQGLTFSIPSEYYKMLACCSPRSLGRHPRIRFTNTKCNLPRITGLPQASVRDRSLSLPPCCRIISGQVQSRLSRALATHGNSKGIWNAYANPLHSTKLESLPRSFHSSYNHGKTVSCPMDDKRIHMSTTRPSISEMTSGTKW
ncbi:hypothetical protein EDD16DRAFT_1635422 [Pisolithus croceorrhizus]|nr:hypothetical protein EDD16DRAFT_1635422 [Pisolithus croceorrhizus]KAI6167724.1 hypothetical protein EDD17DRAFT_858684 [Pisolithus thermaeus]